MSKMQDKAEFAKCCCCEVGTIPLLDAMEWKTAVILKAAALTKNLLAKAL